MSKYQITEITKLNAGTRIAISLVVIALSMITVSRAAGSGYQYAAQVKRSGTPDTAAEDCEQSALKIKDVKLSSRSLAVGETLTVDITTSTNVTSVGMYFFLDGQKAASWYVEEHATDSEYSTGRFVLKHERRSPTHFALTDSGPGKLIVKVEGSPGVSGCASREVPFEQK